MPRCRWAIWEAPWQRGIVQQTYWACIGAPRLSPRKDRPVREDSRGIYEWTDLCDPDHRPVRELQIRRCSCISSMKDNGDESFEFVLFLLDDHHGHRPLFSKWCSGRRG